MNGPENLIAVPVDSAPLPTVQNHTRHPSQYYQMLDVSGQVFHVIVSRLTYTLRRVDGHSRPLLADLQTPLVATDEFYGEVNASSVIQESDFAAYKPKCDILFTHATAHAPGGQPAPRWPVEVRIGDWAKRFTVTGPRYAEPTRDHGWRITGPEPASQVPIRYEQAFGGTCQWPLRTEPDQQPELLAREEHNPVGCGYVDEAWLAKSRGADIDVPQIEVPDRPFDEGAIKAQSYPALGLGAIGRWWLPRRLKAGTYGDDWKQTRWPHLPLDFDFGYWNAAPEDQQIDYPQGGEPVVLIHLHPTPEVRFNLPKPDLKMLLHLEAGVPLFKLMNIDTLIFDMQTLQLIVVQRGLVAARAGVDRIELGTWDIAAARAANANLLNPPP